MNLRGGEIARAIARPDPTRPGLLIWGADGARVAQKRAEAVAALLGPQGEAEMRLTRLAGADLRRDPAPLRDAVKATGFFPGQRVVLVDDASDGCTPAAEGALDDWAPGDAVMILTAGALTKSSSLRTLFERHPRALAAGIYDDPPGEAEIATWAAEAGIAELPREAARAFAELARAIEPGELRQTIARVGLWKHGDPSPLTPDEIAALAPQTIEGDVDAVIDAAMDGREGEVGRQMRRLEAQNIAPTTVAIAALRHVRGLHAVAVDPAGGLSRLRPPPPFARRDVMARQARAWGVRALEEAIGQLVDADLVLRSSPRAPALAIIERVLLRLAVVRKGR